MNQDQINAVVGAVVQAVVKTLVEQITPIVVEEVKKEIMAGAQGVLAMEPETLNKPILAVIMGDDAVRDEIVELIENSDPVHSLKKDVSIRWVRSFVIGLPHSETPGSLLASNSPEHIVGNHVLLRLCVPRYPP